MLEKHDAIRHLSANVSFAMKHEDVTVRALAFAVKAPPSTIQTLIKGDHDSGVFLVSRVAEFFDVSVDELLKKPVEFRRAFRRQAIAC